MDTTFPYLRSHYGEKLPILELDTEQDDNYELLQAAVRSFDPDLTAGTPALFIGEHFMLGTDEIMLDLPGIIDSYLAQGGFPWPDIPNIGRMVASFNPDKAPASAHLRLSQRFKRDPLGNTIALIVLIFLAGSRLRIMTGRTPPAVPD